jgi:hypothetical protein
LALGGTRDLAIVLALALVVLLSFGDQPKFFVPVRFQRSRHQTIIRVHAEKAPSCQLGLVASTVNLSPPKAIHLFPTGLQFLLHGQGHFQG